MKIVLIAAGVIAALILIIVVIGAMLPKHHSASRSAFIKASPEQVFALISGPQDWRADLKSHAVVVENGKHLVRETDKHGQTITYERVQFDPPKVMQHVIADKNLPYGGGWTWRVRPENDGCRVTITEDAEVYPPIFRFVSRFVIGYTRTIDDYLAQLTNVAEQRQ